VDPPLRTGPGQPTAFTLPRHHLRAARDRATDKRDKSAHLKLPRPALRGLTRSQFCVFITGTSDADNKTTAACWLFQ